MLNSNHLLLFSNSLDLLRAFEFVNFIMAGASISKHEYAEADQPCRYDYEPPFNV